MRSNSEIVVNAERIYSVYFSEDWRRDFQTRVKKYERNLVLIPESLKSVIGLDDLAGANIHLMYLPDGEAQKDITIASKIWEVAGELGLRRSDAIWGIGGGATTDLAGFVAATWLRGIDWFAIPTSLAGMVDASVGGKTGINSPAGKNLIGAFHSPSEVIIDINFLNSLSDRDFAAGLAEVIKTGFISDTEILKLLHNCAGIAQARLIAKELIFRSVTVKARVVSADFKEGKLREILNYGHTLGHAIEKREKYTLRHGEAIAIGLAFIAHLSALLSSLSNEDVQLHIDLLKKFGLPTSYAPEAFEELLALMANDKKARASGIRFIGLAKLGEPTWLERVSQSEMKSAYERISQ